MLRVLLPTLVAVGLMVSGPGHGGTDVYAGRIIGNYGKGFDAYQRDDYATALRELRPLASEGYPPAQTLLGIMYDFGQGVPQDHVEAVHWYQKAAEQGDMGAQGNLARMYVTGQGVPKDYAEAARWYQKAAEQGLASAQAQLGGLYGKGWGVPQDTVLAHMWSNLAAAQGDKTGMKNRDIAVGLLSPADISTAQRLARECLARQYKGC